MFCFCLCMHRHRDTIVWSLWLLDIAVFGKARIQNTNQRFSGVSRLSKVRVMFGVKIRFTDQCVERLKCLRTKMTIHQFKIYLLYRNNCNSSVYV